MEPQQQTAWRPLCGAGLEPGWLSPHPPAPPIGWPGQPPPRVTWGLQGHCPRLPAPTSRAACPSHTTVGTRLVPYTEEREQELVRSRAQPSHWVPDRPEDLGSRAGFQMRRRTSVTSTTPLHPPPPPAPACEPRRSEPDWMGVRPFVNRPSAESRAPGTAGLGVETDLPLPPPPPPPTQPGPAFHPESESVTQGNHR